MFMDEIAKQHVAYLTQDCQSERIRWNGQGLHSHTLTTAEIPSHSSNPAAHRPRSLNDIQAAIIAMIDQVEAEEKARVAEAAKAQEAARPVMAAIEATHRAFRSDGRPHRYDDPLLTKKA